MEQVTFSSRILAAAGINVRGEFGSWRKLVGEIHPIMIGGVSFGAGSFQLTEVSISETVLDVNGNFIAATLAFTFTEYISANAAATAKTTTTNSTATIATNNGSTKNSKNTASTTSAQKSMAANIAAKKNEALNTKASATDKAKKNPYG